MHYSYSVTMFYNYLFLGKRGALSKIWIAAHWEKKLTKAHVFECNLESAIQSIMAQKIKIALRTSGHLLFGVVRIYNRKAGYLLADCNEALLHMRSAFRTGSLDLSDKNLEASYKAITLPEEFRDFDLEMPDLNAIDVVDHFTLNQSRVEDITMREEYDRLAGFGEDIDPIRHGSASDVAFEVSANSVLPESSALLPGDTRDFFSNDLFGDEGAATDFFDDNPFFNELNDLINNQDVCQDVTLPPEDQPPEDQPPEDYVDDTEESLLEDIPVANTTTLVSDEEIAFVLEPIDVSVIEKKKQRKRRRKIMVDDVMQISSCRMHEQLKNTTDIVRTLDLAPTNQQLMRRGQIGGVQWLLSHPSHPIINTELLQLYPEITMEDTRRHMQKKTAEPETRTVQHEQDIELPQVETTKATDASFSIADDLVHTSSDLSDFHQGTSDVNSSAHEEYANGLLGCTDEELREPPQSVQSNEEQQQNKRNKNLLHDLRKLNQSGVSALSLQNLCKNNKRKQVSTKFYSLLMLNQRTAIKLTQSAPFSDIMVTPGPSFHSL